MLQKLHAVSACSRGFLCAAGFILLAFASAARAEVRVLASIKPLALIGQVVVGDAGQVATLLPVKASPHDYPLRVSDVQRLHAADVVLWVGPELETFLQRPLANIAPDKTLSAYALPGIHWPDSEVSAGADHQHAHDPHLWLDPRNAAVIARALAQQLGALEPSSAAVFQANAEQFAVRATALDQQLAEALKPIASEGFAVYHEGYLHFVAHYGLQQLAYVTFTPERRPGAKHLYELRQTLAGKASCLFIEPYYDMGMAEDLAEELNLRLARLDPIGDATVTTYQQLLENMAHAFIGCLKPA